MVPVLPLCLRVAARRSESARLDEEVAGVVWFERAAAL